MDSPMDGLGDTSGFGSSLNASVDNGSSRHSLGNRHGHSGVEPNGGIQSTLLRAQQAEREKITMENFNQALRINFLEERLLRYKKGTAFEGEDLENEVFQLRMTIEEKNQELQQKGMTIVRATSMIDGINQELRAAREEIARLRNSAPDTEAVMQLRQELELAHAREHASAQRQQDLEREIGKHLDTVANLTTTHQELLIAHGGMERELELNRQEAQQKIEALESKARMDAEQLRSQGKHREEDVAAMRERMDKMAREKEQLELRWQSKMKGLEEQVQAQMARLQHESDNYRQEHTRLIQDHEKSRFDRERLTVELESAKQDKTKYQFELERLTKELERRSGETESLRLQNVKLTSTWENQTQTLESYKVERETAMDSIHKLEAEVQHWRKVCAERESATKALETRVQQGEAEVRRLNEQLNLVSARNQQNSNERLLALEKDRQAIEQDNYRLRKEMTTFQHEMEAMARKFKSCEEHLADESSSVRKFREQLGRAERELEQKNALVDKLERYAADVTASNSVSETTRLQQQTEHANRFAAEKKQLMEAMQAERERVNSLEKTISHLEANNASLVKELEAAEREFSAMIGSEVQLQQSTQRRGLISLVRSVVQTIHRDVKNEMSKLQNQWEHQAGLMSRHLDQLSNQLQLSQRKVEMLQQTVYHSKDDKLSLERSWSMKYERICAEKDAAYRAMDDELHREKAKLLKAEANIAQIKSDLESVSRSRTESITELKSDYQDIKESNRLLFDEVQERRRAAERLRKQYMAVVKENKSLLAANEVYKQGLSDREKDIEYYRANLMKYAQQLQRQVSMGDVKQTLLEQLQQTQYMIDGTFKRWSDSGYDRPSVDLAMKSEHRERKTKVDSRQSDMRRSKEWTPLDRDFLHDFASKSALQSPTNQLTHNREGRSRTLSKQFSMNPTASSSMTTLGRISADLQEIEKKMKEFPE